MAIELPAVDFLHSYPDWPEQVSLSRAGARMVAAVEYGDPFLQVTLRTRPLRASQRLAVEAFRDAARGGLVTVLYRPHHQCAPKAYWGNAGAAVLSNLGNLSAKSGYVVTVNSMDNGLVLGAGDLVSFTTGDYNWMARIVAGGTSSGNAVNLTLNVPVPAFIATGAVVRFKDPLANTRLLPGSFSMPDAPHPSASFTLVEVPK